MAISRFGNDGSGSTPSATTAISPGMSTISISIRSNMIGAAGARLAVFVVSQIRPGRPVAGRLGRRHRRERNRFRRAEPAAVARMSAEMCGQRTPRNRPGYRSAHPGYACGFREVAVSEQSPPAAGNPHHKDEWPWPAAALGDQSVDASTTICAIPVCFRCRWQAKHGRSIALSQRNPSRHR